MIRTSGLTKRFGGITATDSVDFELGTELTSIIGPNGAGKTTFFNLLTGELRPTEGTIELKRDGEWVDITNSPPPETAQLGVHRSFQITNVFPTTSVLENVRIAAQAHGNNSVRFWRNVNAFDDHIEEAHRILDRVGLAERPSWPQRTSATARNGNWRSPLRSQVIRTCCYSTSQTPASPRRASTTSRH
jgi:branched-chain amino acid transport system ATP-binding protein